MVTANFVSDLPSVTGAGIGAEFTTTTNQGITMNINSLTIGQAKELAAQTFAGAAALVQASSEAPEVLRQRVTSKGGTTHEAITSMQANHVEQHIVAAMQACYQRGQEMGREFV